MGNTLKGKLELALDLRAGLELPDTDCLRLFHGSGEGMPGVAVDRYGPLILVQSWHEPLEEAALESVHRVVGTDLPLVWRHRGQGEGLLVFGEIPESPVGLELGLRFDVTPIHRGQDPLLFLDFRAARRWVRGNSHGKSVLNLFAYTCGIGVAAAAGGATRVVNVDFASSALEVGQRNAGLNELDMETWKEDVTPVVRQLAGLPVGGRANRRPAYRKVDKEAFDLVILDPPRWAKSRWGAIDVVRDYPSLFKPALLATAEGGTVLATNHVPSVELEDWLGQLRRTAKKAGRPLRAIDTISPEGDFPSLDGKPPLKMALCSV